jgi:hypothetical protein
MSTQLKLRRGTTAQHSTFTGAEGEVTVDTTKDTLVVHDGTTAGGVPVATEASVAALSSSTTTSLGNKLNTANPSYTGTLTGAAATFSGIVAANGGGIQFPATQVASANANTLDDYEEGTWTPTISGVNLTGLTWGSGFYTKVGRLVTLIGSATVTVTSSNVLTYLTMSAPFTAGAAGIGSAFLNDNVKSGTSQISGTSVYAFFPAASAPVAGAEVIQLSITYQV